MKSKGRRTLEKWAKGMKKEPIYLAEGQVFMFPSESGEFSHHLVVWLKRELPSGRVQDEFACSCPGFAYHPGDLCRHVKELKAAIVAEGGLKMAAG